MMQRSPTVLVRGIHVAGRRRGRVQVCVVAAGGSAAVLPTRRPSSRFHPRRWFAAFARAELEVECVKACAAACWISSEDYVSTEICCLPGLRETPLTPSLVVNWSENETALPFAVVLCRVLAVATMEDGGSNAIVPLLGFAATREASRRPRSVGCRIGGPDEAPRDLVWAPAATIQPFQRSERRSESEAGTCRSSEDKMSCSRQAECRRGVSSW